MLQPSFAHRFALLLPPIEHLFPLLLPSFAFRFPLAGSFSIQVPPFTRMLEVVSKQLRLLRDRLVDSTTLVNSLSPQMSELVEDAVASWCANIVGHFWLIRNEFQKFAELKFEFFSFNTFDVSDILATSSVNRGPNTVIAFSWRDCARFLFVGYWITHCVPCLGVFSGFYIVPHCAINIWHHMLCYLTNIYNYITFTASLRRECNLSSRSLSQ